jgi:hypothetical protein
MTMALAVIIIAVIGVMGAGLLTFVTKDLNTVIEENRGQRAFEIADAGIEAAERQLESDCIGNNTCMVFYNDPEDEPDGDDKQWSVAKGGLTLNNLAGPGEASDSVTVTIDYTEVDPDENDDNVAVNDNYYRVISTGTFGSSKRKIEAIFKPIAGGGGGGGNIINPAYYTPSDIRIWSDETGGVEVKGMSLFSERNIIIEGLLPYTSCVEPDPADTDVETGLPLYPRGYRDPDYRKALADFDDVEAHDLCLKREWEDTNDADKLTTTNGKRVLKDWNSRTFDPDGMWNTVGRRDRFDTFFDGVGFGALGMICGGTPSMDPTDCDDPSDSVADGRYGYDSTTGTRGQKLTFVDKAPINDTCGTGPDCYGFNDEGTITFPFERKRPDAARLKQLAINTDGFYRGQPADWNTVFSGNRLRVVFIDAENQEITLDGGNPKGIIVVWCGNLNMTNVDSYQGIIMTLNGSGEGLPPDPETGQASTNCEPPDPPDPLDPPQGQLSVINSDLKAWFYAEGGNVSDPGVELGPGTQIDFLPSGSFQLLDLLLEDATPTQFNLQGWRECYQIADPKRCST